MLLSRNVGKWKTANLCRILNGICQHSSCRRIRKDGRRVRRMMCHVSGRKEQLDTVTRKDENIVRYLKKGLIINMFLTTGGTRASLFQRQRRIYSFLGKWGCVFPQSAVFILDYIILYIVRTLTKRAWSLQMLHKIDLIPLFYWKSPHK